MLCEPLARIDPADFVGREAPELVNPNPLFRLSSQELTRPPDSVTLTSASSQRSRFVKDGSILTKLHSPKDASDRLGII